MNMALIAMAVELDLLERFAEQTVVSFIKLYSFETKYLLKIKMYTS